MFGSRLSTGFVGSTSLGGGGSPPALRGGTTLARRAVSGRQGLRDLCLEQLQLPGQLVNGLCLSSYLRLDRAKLKRQLSYFLLLTLDDGMGRIQLIH